MQEHKVKGSNVAIEASKKNMKSYRKILKKIFVELEILEGIKYELIYDYQNGKINYGFPVLRINTFDLWDYAYIIEKFKDMDASFEETYQISEKGVYCIEYDLWMIGLNMKKSKVVKGDIT